MSSNVSALLDDVRAGRRGLSDLNASEFEEVVLALLSERMVNMPRGAVVSRELRGEIDFVIKIPYEGVSGPRETIHFIEAKNYRENLTLDIAGKAFCATIRYKPSTLIIACRSDLQRQPLEYANYFFNENTTQFRLWNLARNLEEPGRPSNGRPLPDGLGRPLFHILKTEIWRDSVFRHECIYTSDTPRIPLRLSLAYSHFVGIYIEFGEHGEDAEFSAALIVGGETFDGKTKIDKYGDFAMITVDLRSIVLETLSARQGSEGLQLQITATRPTRQTLQSIALPAMSIAAQASLWPDMRGPLVEYWANEIGEPNGTRLLFVSGEGGVGKTFFTHEVCRELQSRGGTDCSHLIVDQTDAYGFFSRLLSTLLDVPSLTGEDTRALKQELLRSILSAQGDGPNSDGIVAPEDLGDSCDAAFLVDRISVVARCIANLGVSKVLVISNAQRMDPTLIDALRVLVYSIEQFGWSNVALILEYRDTSDQANPALERLADQLISDRIGKSRRLWIDRLSYDELYNYVQQAFPSNEAEFVTDVLQTRTGGNCLFLDQLTRHYVENEVISLVRTGDRTVARINDISAFAESPSRPEPVTRLLIDRLRYLDRDLNDYDVENLVSRAMGMAAILNAFDCDGLAHILGMDIGQMSEVLERLLDERILVRPAGEQTHRFVHDFMKQSCLLGFEQLPTTNEDCRKALESLSADGAEADLLRGTILEFIGMRTEALTAYDAAYTGASTREYDFGLQRRALRNIDGLLSAERSFNATLRMKQVEVLETLGWAENNVGSSSAAMEAYERAYEVVKKSGVSSDIFTPPVVQERLAAESHALLGLHVLRHDLTAAAAWAKEALALVNDPTRLGKILNRLIKLAVYWDCAAAARSFSDLALRCADASEDPEVHAVLAIDVGEIYLLVQPHAVARARAFGAAVASEERQRLHNEIHLHIAESLAAGCWSAETEVRNTQARAKAVGVRSVEEHTLLWFGSAAFHQKNWLFDAASGIQRPFRP